MIGFGITDPKQCMMRNCPIWSLYHGFSIALFVVGVGNLCLIAKQSFPK